MPDRTLAEVEAENETLRTMFAPQLARAVAEAKHRALVQEYQDMQRRARAGEAVNLVDEQRKFHAALRELGVY